ncbi:MAG: NAD(P)H-dependent oxidoreductase [Alphaproteobacteria bacterium]|jgi:NAD(P)H-dependent FMN reductase|nr:NAD(P)H-dependent oxidoreductase [Alphaproteobacteria bacterium]|tara:strand:- start:381 stop:962 length:582 start_codon:yes stop_codon:yes gene_type:complete
MPKPSKILAFAGSTRTASFNKQLVRIAAQGAKAAGAEVTRIDLRDYPMPLYDGDLEAADGPPDSARALKVLMVGHDGFLIASPEYNSGFSAVLKNAIDWVSRPTPGELPLIAFKGKVAGLLSASPGRLGGVRGLVHLRLVLGTIGVLVIPDQVAVADAGKAFAEDGNLLDESRQAAVIGIGEKVVRLVATASD